jgi:hypothetical protein
VKPRSRRLRRALAGLTLALTLAGGLAVAVDVDITPASDTAWGAPATTNDTAWGTPPTDGTGTGLDDGSTPITPYDTAWG